jgi:radical SAM superfamily enzyme YgiQ (UPF0313 family)
MSKVLLIRMAYSDVYSVYPDPPQHREIRPPLGLLCLAGALEGGWVHHEVRVWDAEPLGKTTIDMNGETPDVVGITATTPEFHGAHNLCCMIKTVSPNTLTVVGGAHVSALPEESLSDWIDYIVVGEGEEAMLRIVNDRPQERIIQGNHSKMWHHLYPARAHVDYDNYYFPVPGKGMTKMDVVESSRGCPFRCSFCFNRATLTRYKEAERVISEISSSYWGTGARFFMFLDDTLTVNKKHILAICEEIQRTGLHKLASFYGNARANCADRDVLEAMRAANFVELSLGVESGDQAILDSVGKGTTLDQYRQAYADMTELGFQTRGSFILGLPGETHETVRRTIDFAKELDLMRASCNILTPYPGTQLYQQAKRGDGLRLLTEDWREFKRWGNCVIETDELSRDDLIGYQKQFLKEFYTQPKVLAYHAKQWAAGNRSRYFYRPLAFALRQRLGVQ